jgi:hypothetical protein
MDPIRYAGTIPTMHLAAAKDRQAARQVQPEAEWVQDASLQTRRVLHTRLMRPSSALVLRGPWPAARQIQGGQDRLRRDAGRELHAQQPAASKASIRLAGKLCPSSTGGVRPSDFARAAAGVWGISAAAARSSASKLVRPLSSDYRFDSRIPADVNISVLSACAATLVNLALQLDLRTLSNSQAYLQDIGTRQRGSNLIVRHRGSQAVLPSNVELP